MTMHVVLLLLLHLLWCLAARLLLRWEKTLFPLMLFVPVWGTAAVLLVHRRPPAARQWSAVDTLYDRTTAGPVLPEVLPCRAAELVPLEEALLLDTAAQRRRLMLLLLADDPARHYGLLELARRDKDSEVAHYAAASMALAGKRADRERDELYRQYQAAPQDEACCAAYRQQLQKMLENGLVQGRAAVLLRRQLAALLQASLQKAPDYTVGCQLAQVQLALQDTAAAGQTITFLLNRWPQREEPWLLHLRCAVIRRDGAGLQAALREIRQRHIWFGAAGRETLQFWQEGEKQG